MRSGKAIGTYGSVILPVHVPQIKSSGDIKLAATLQIFGQLLHCDIVKLVHSPWMRFAKCFAALFGSEVRPISKNASAEHARRNTSIPKLGFKLPVAASPLTPDIVD
jgi:hypothetical protein